MTDETLSSPAIPPDAASKPKRPKRTDAEGRARAGSQMSLQVWVNARSVAISASIVEALGFDPTSSAMTWLSPIQKSRYREFRDAAFLGTLGLGYYAKLLRDFWPKGGPVWDGLGVIARANCLKDAIVLVEAKSYPAEVLGNGCMAEENSEARKTISASLDATARWLGKSSRPDSWMGELYQSANRLAHLYFLRERLGLEAYMVNVCFSHDQHPRRATTVEQWETAKLDFRRRLELDGMTTPWLVDITLATPRPEELLSVSDIT